MVRWCCFSLLVAAVLSLIASDFALALSPARGLAPAALRASFPNQQRGSSHGGPSPPSERRQQASSAYAFVAPEATDPTGLTVAKTWNSSTNNWDLTLSWSGGMAPYTLSYSTDPSFQIHDVTLAQGTTITSLTQPADTTASLECFAVSDESVVSPAVQGMGYDPTPAPQVTSLASTGLWWGDPVTANGGYLDVIAKANVASFYDLPVRATLATPAGNEIGRAHV
jgi:hypothetical protein